MSVRVEVVIPHRSRWDLLERCLDSLDAQTVRPSVCVVDNASRDETLARLAERPRVRVEALAVNVGFGRAVNRGVATSRAEIVVILNNDMVLEPDCVERLMRTLDEHAPCVTAARQLRLDGRIDTIGVAVDEALCAYDVGHGLRPDELARETLAPVGPSGGAAAFPREVFLRLGGYDERFFAYLEDVDLGLRLARAGVPFHPTPGAIAWHAHSSTLGGGSRRKNELMGWSRGYLLWKYRPALSRRARLRGVVTDAVVCLGQVAIDRNAGALRGRVAFRRFGRRSPASGIAGPLETGPITAIGGLRRRMGRR